MSNKRQHHEEHTDERWLIPYADILTLLLALFIVLFASSTVDQRKFNAMKEAFNVIFNGNQGLLYDGTVSNNMLDEMVIAKDSNDIEELQKVKQKFDQYIAEKDLSAKLETKIVNGYLVITIRDDVLFDSGSADIRSDSKKKVADIAKILQAQQDCEVLVAGHTDNVPIHNARFETNWDLSSERALNFMKLLLQNENLDPRRFSAIGYGEYRPIAPNDTEEGRAKNRRVEVTIRVTHGSLEQMPKSP